MADHQIKVKELKQSTMKDYQKLMKGITFYFKDSTMEKCSEFSNELESFSTSLQMVGLKLANKWDVQLDDEAGIKRKRGTCASRQGKDCFTRHSADVYLILVRSCSSNNALEELATYLHHVPLPANSDVSQLPDFYCIPALHPERILMSKFKELCFQFLSFLILIDSSTSKQGTGPEVISIHSELSVITYRAQIRALLEKVQYPREKFLHSQLKRIDLKVPDERSIEDRPHLEKVSTELNFENVNYGFFQRSTLGHIGDEPPMIVCDYETRPDAGIQYDKAITKTLAVRHKMEYSDLINIFCSHAESADHAKSPGPHKWAKYGDGSLSDLEKWLTGKAGGSIFHDLHSRRAQLDSNEEPDAGHEEREMSWKNDLNAHGDVGDARTEVGRTEVERLDEKDLHPLGVSPGPQTSPERIEEPRPCEGFPEKYTPILNLEDENIPFARASTPPPRPPEVCTGPLPADTRIHPGDLSPRLDMKSDRRDYHEVTEMDKVISMGNLPIARKGYEHPYTGDINDYADEYSHCGTELKDSLPSEISPPETRSESAGERGGPSHQEEEYTAEDSVRSLSTLKAGVPQRNLSQGRPESGQTPLEAVSLRHRNGQLCGRYELPPDPPRISPLENPAVSIRTLKGRATSIVDLPNQAESVFEPQPQESRRYETPGGDVYSVAKLEILLLEALSRESDMTTSRLPESSQVQRPVISDQDYVSLAESKRTVLTRDSRMGTDQHSSLGTAADPFHSVKVRESHGKLFKTKSEKVEASAKNPSKGRSFNFDSHDAAASQWISLLETSPNGGESVVTDRSRETARLGEFRRMDGTFLSSYQLLSQWEFLRACSLAVSLRPLFPNLQNGILHVDFRSPVREAMIIETFRLCTLLYCPSAEAMPSLRLANAGFYYTGRNGMLACYSCDLTCHHDDARLQGDPYEFHREMNSHCSHLNNIDRSHLFIQNQRLAESGRDITGSQRGTRSGQESVQEMTAAIRRETGQAFIRQTEALHIASTETRAPGVAALRVPGSGLGPQSSAADVPAHGATTAPAGAEGGSQHLPHNVSSSNPNGESARNVQEVSTNTIIHAANREGARQNSSAPQHPTEGVEAFGHITNGQTAPSGAAQRGGNAAVRSQRNLDPGGQLAAGGGGTAAGNQWTSYETAGRSSGDVAPSPGDLTNGYPRAVRQAQQDPESRQTPSRPDLGSNNTPAPTVLTTAPRAHAPPRSNIEPIAGNDSRSPVPPRLGLPVAPPQTLVWSAVNASASTANNALQGGDVQPTPRQVGTATPSDLTGPAPSVPAYDPSRAVHRQYADVQTRERSFLGRWPDTHAQSPEELALAGFFYAGTEDCVRCHYCGLGLKHWDPDDSPINEHVRWRSSCAYLRAILDDDFIARTLAALGRRTNGSPGENSQAEGRAVSPRSLVSNGNASQMTSPGRREIERFMTSEVVAPAREMGFSDDVIRGGIRALLSTSVGHRAVTARNVVQAILFLRERGRDLDSPTPNNANIVDVSSDDSDNEAASPLTNGSEMHHGANTRESANGGAMGSISGFPQSRDALVFFAARGQDVSENGGQSAGSDRTPQFDSRQSRRSQGDPDASTNGLASAQTLRQLEQENQELRERRRCKICLDNDVSILFLPCGHLVCCAECAPALRRCPMCRKRVTATVSIQFSGLPTGQQQ